MRILARYIIREHLGPFVLSLAILTLLFLMNELLEILDWVIGKGLKVSIVLELLVYNLAWMLALTVPMAVLVSVMVAFGRLSADGEITALRASGISMLRLIVPILLLAVIVFISQIYFNDRVLPEFNYRTKSLASDIRMTRPTIALEPGIFVETVSGYTLYLGGVESETNRVEDVTIIQYLNFPAPGPPRIIRADWGTITFDEATESLNLDLRHGTVTEVRQGQTRVQDYEQLKTFIAMEGTTLRRSDTGVRGDREMSVAGLRERAAARDSSSIRSAQQLADLPAPYLARVIRGEAVDLPGAGHSTEPADRIILAHRSLANNLRSAERSRTHFRRQSNAYMVEVHKKFSIPFACLVFVLIGVPLALMTRSGAITGFGYALAFYLLFWVFLMVGEELGDRGIVRPWLSMWAPNLVVGTAGILLMVRTVREQTVIRWVEIARRLPGPPGRWLVSKLETP